MTLDLSTVRLKRIPPDRIDANPENPRLIFRPEEMEQLLTSIDKFGIQVPLVIYQDGDRYRLIDGERRWKCAQKLNLKSVPAIVQNKPSELENLLLMYNIHALREQWDYFTIASNLNRVISLLTKDLGRRPTEGDLSDATGLTRGQIRRCRLLLELPERYKAMLLQELKLPKSQQQLTEDFFIEMEKSLKAVVKRVPEYASRRNQIRDALVKKYREGLIQAVTDFRQLSKIATAIDKLGLTKTDAKRSLDRLFDPEQRTGIREAYSATVAFEYSEKEALRYVESLKAFLDDVLAEHRKGRLDRDLVSQLRGLYERLRKLLKG